jgi:hypothetical protein
LFEYVKDSEDSLPTTTAVCVDQLHPVVLPHVSHFMQVPLRTSVKLPHSEHISPS